MIKNNPANEGSMPTGLGRLSNKFVYIQTADTTFRDRYFVAFVSGTLAKNEVYPDQPQFKQNFELTRFKVINPDFLVANHPPVITDHGLFLIVLASEKKSIIVADVYDLENIDKLTLKSRTNCFHNPTGWIHLSLVDLKIILELEVPQDAEDDECTVNFEVNDNDTNSPMTVKKKIKIDVFAVKPDKVPPPTFNA